MTAHDIHINVLKKFWNRVFIINPTCVDAWGICLSTFHHIYYSGIILGMGSGNDRRLYYVTPAFIGWSHTQNEPSSCTRSLTLSIQCWVLNGYQHFCIYISTLHLYKWPKNLITFHGMLKILLSWMQISFSSLLRLMIYKTHTDQIYPI